MHKSKNGRKGPRSADCPRSTAELLSVRWERSGGFSVGKRRFDDARRFGRIGPSMRGRSRKAGQPIRRERTNQRVALRFRTKKPLQTNPGLFSTTVRDRRRQSPRAKSPNSILSRTAAKVPKSAFGMKHTQKALSFAGRSKQFPTKARPICDRVECKWVHWIGMSAGRAAKTSPN